MPPSRFVPLVLVFALVRPGLGLAASSVDQLGNRQWIDVRSANFRVVTEQPEKVARQMVVDLETLRYVSNRVRGTTSLEGPPLTIVALGPDSSDTLAIPRNFAGLFQLSRRGYAAVAKVADSWLASSQIEKSRDVFLHEYHHFLLAYTLESTDYPLWYNEGMSEYWSSMKIEDGKVWFGNPSRQNGRENNLYDRFGKINFDTRFLFARTRLTEGRTAADKADIANFYSRSRFAIHYFNSTPELRKQLAHYLRLHNMGLSQDEAVRLAFKQTYEQLDAALRNYVSNGIVRRGFDIDGGASLPQVAVEVAPLDRAAVFAVLADVVPRFLPPDSPVTPALVAANLALNPNDPDALALDMEQSHPAPDEATTRLAELERRFPGNARLLALHANAVASAAAKRSAAGDKDWRAALEQARDLYRRSIAASAFNPRAYFGLGTLYAAVPDLQPVDEGIAALDTAVIYEGHPHMFRTLADLYLRKKQLRPALASIRSAVAFNKGEPRPFDLLLLQNLELLMDLTEPAPVQGGLGFKSGSVYTGPVRDGKPEGEGSWLRPDGSSYVGEFRNGLPSGHGTLKSERGAVYEGSFAEGYAHGRGHVQFAGPGNMVSYEGEVDRATPHGEGVLETRGSRVVGTFVNGMLVRGTTAASATAAPRAARKSQDAESGSAVLYKNGCNGAEAMKTAWCRYNNQQPLGPRKTGPE
jgi:hypothetical protein